MVGISAIIITIIHYRNQFDILQSVCACIGFLSILDFLYFGEANVFQEDLDSFLAIAEEMQLKGLTEQTSNNLIESKENTKLSEPMNKSNDVFQKGKTHQQEIIPKEKVSLSDSTAVVISDH